MRRNEIHGVGGSMAGVVTVLLVVDTQTLLDKVPDPSLDAKHPTDLGGFDGCYLIAAPNPSGRAAAGVEVALAPLDGGLAEGARILPRIRWRTLPLCGLSDNAVVLYRVDPDIISGRAGAATSARAFETPLPVPLPILVGNQNTEPPSFDAAVVHDYYLETQLRKRGPVPFVFSFYVTDLDEVGKPVLAGYFRWRGTVAANGGGSAGESTSRPG